MCLFQNRCYVQERTVSLWNSYGNKKKPRKLKKKCRNSTRGYLSTRIRMWWFLWSWHFFYTGKRVVFQVITGCLFFVVKKHSMKVHCSPSHKFRDKVSQHTCIPIHIHVHRPFCNMKTVIGLLKLSRFFFIKLWHFRFATFIHNNFTQTLWECDINEFFFSFFFFLFL